jgi:hypothetical protein
MRTGLNLIHCPQPQHLKSPVIQFPAVVLAHAPILSDQTPEVDLLLNSLVTGITSSTTGSAMAEPSAAYTQAEMQQNFRRIQDQFNALRADTADLKQIVNSVIDDLQTLGLVG